MSDDREFEAVLRRYQPLAPPPELRDRVLGASPAEPSWGIVLRWLALAVSLVLSFALDRATARVDWRLAAADHAALGARALIASQVVPELAAAGLMQPYARRRPPPLWLGTSLPEGELP